MKTLNCVAIVGVGLIGGSVGLALRSRDLAKKVVGTGSRPATLEAAMQLGAITAIAADLKRAVAEADLVVVCAPVGHIVEQVRQIAPLCRPGTLITDAGSTKAEIVGRTRASRGRAIGLEPRGSLCRQPSAGRQREKRARSTPAPICSPVAPSSSRPRPTRAADDCQTLARFLDQPGGPGRAKCRPTSTIGRWRRPATCRTWWQRPLRPRRPSSTLRLPPAVGRIRRGSPPATPLLWRQIMLANRANLLASLDRFDHDCWPLGARPWTAGDAAALERLLTEAKRIRDAVGS